MMPLALFHGDFDEQPDDYLGQTANLPDTTVMLCLLNAVKVVI